MHVRRTKARRYSILRDPGAVPFFEWSNRLMASDPTSFPDPFSSDPFQDLTDTGSASASPADSTSANPPDPLAAGASQPALAGDVAPASDGASTGGVSTPQSGVWFDDTDPQYLIQWSLKQAQDPQLAAANPSQVAPPTTYQARVRIFQEVFETTLAAVRPVVPFSLRDAITLSPCLQGSLVLLQQPSDPPMLLVKNLKFSGFQQAQVVLFPTAPDAPGGPSGG
jgi:hypothetical protein